VEAASPGARERAAALQADNAEILARYPPHLLAARIRHQLARERARAARRWLWAPALATAATAFVVVLWVGHKGPPTTAPGGDPIVDGEVRSKGIGPRLLLYRKEGEQVAQLQPGSSAQSGDLIQLGYLANGQRYGVIVSVDARGGATLHFPLTADAPMALGRGGPVLLDRAFQLDDAPAFERFFLVTTDEAHRAALRVEDVLAAARRLAADSAVAETAPLTLAAGLHQESFLLRKKPRG
jgi:hypothetical protein